MPAPPSHDSSTHKPIEKEPTVCSTDQNLLELTDKNAACNCSTHDSHEAAAPVATAVSAEYLVEGMTCSHCVSSVTEEITAIDGVAGVSVNLQVGGQSKVTVASDAPVSDEAIRAAVEEAGYTLAGSRP
jgi:copper chaperone CopZ